MSDSHAGYRTIHVISDADKAKAKVEKDAKAAKAAEREKLRSDVANQAIKALEILAATEKSLYSRGVGKRALVELDHKAGTVEVKPVDKERLWYLIHNAVPEWDDEKLIALVARYIMQHRSFEGFRPLEAIISTPAFISGFTFVGGARLRFPHRLLLLPTEGAGGSLFPRARNPDGCEESLPAPSGLVQ